jgi:hypothetical protein
MTYIFTSRMSCGSLDDSARHIATEIVSRVLGMGIHNTNAELAGKRNNGLILVAQTSGNRAHNFTGLNPLIK